MGDVTLERVRDVSDDYRGEATLYKTSEPVTLTGGKFIDEEFTSEYWVVSSVTGHVGGPAVMTLNSLSGKGKTNHVDETMVFPANEAGEMENSTDIIDVEPADEERAVERLREKINS